MKAETVTPHRAEIWFATLPLDISSRRTGGNRPIAIISNDAFNKSSEMVVAVPLTSKLRRLDLPTHVVIDNECLVKTSLALCEQLRTLDTTQLQFRLGRLTCSEQQAIEKAIKIQLAMAS